MDKAQLIDDRNIVLVGHRCSGKTAVGERLARELGRRFVDTDALIEKRAGSTIEELVLGHGWECFRDIERQVIQEISTGRNLIIATGGGAVMDAANVAHLKTGSWIVWLQADIEVLEKRIIRDRRSRQRRPSLTGADTVVEMAKVLRIRAPYYKKTSDLAVDTSTFDVGEVADLIIGGLARISRERASWRWAATPLERFSG